MLVYRSKIGIYIICYINKFIISVTNKTNDSIPLYIIVRANTVLVLNYNYSKEMLLKLLNNKCSITKVKN